MNYLYSSFKALLLGILILINYQTAYSYAVVYNSPPVEKKIKKKTKSKHRKKKRLKRRNAAPPPTMKKITSLLVQGLIMAIGVLASLIVGLVLAFSVYIYVLIFGWLLGTIICIVLAWIYTAQLKKNQSTLQS